MATKIRLARGGKKRKPIYRIVVADARAPRDGRYIEKIGVFNPNTQPETIVLDDDKAFDWVMKGAQPTDTVRTILSRQGIMLRKHLQVGVNKGAITQEEADKRYEAWLNEKAQKSDAIAAKVAKAQEEKAQQEAEERAKIKAELDAAAAAAIVEVEEAAVETETSEEGEAEGEEGVAVEASAEAAEETPAAEAEEAPAAEAPAEEAPVAEAQEAPKEETPAEEAPAKEEKTEE